MKYRYSPRARQDRKGIFLYYRSKGVKKVGVDILDSIHQNVMLLLNHPNLGYIEPQLEDFPQCFRTLTDTPNYKIIYWIEDDVVKIATVFDCRQHPETLRYIIKTDPNWLCEPTVEYGVKNKTAMNQRTKLDARRFEIIRRITEIEDIELLNSIDQFIDINSVPYAAPEDYPYAPNKDELRSIIEQVLEDDRNGLFMDGEEADREFELYKQKLKDKKREGTL